VSGDAGQKDAGKWNAASPRGVSREREVNEIGGRDLKEIWKEEREDLKRFERRRE
jgi:hypothetical protein